MITARKATETIKDIIKGIRSSIDYYKMLTKMQNYLYKVIKSNILVPIPRIKTTWMISSQS